MLGRIKDKPEVEDRQAPWTGVIVSSRVGAIEDPTGQVVREQIAGAVAIASATAVFLQVEEEGAAATLLAVVRVDSADRMHALAAPVDHPVWDLVAEEDGPAGAGGGSPFMVKDKQLARKTFLISCYISVASIAIALSSPTAKPWHFSSPRDQKATVAPQGSQKTFAAAKDAADALVEAAANFDAPTLKEILGPGSEDLVATEDTVQDKNRAAEFVAKARERTSVTIDPKYPDRAVFLVGNDNWPLPIPIVKRAGRWSFDTKEGRKEILLRRIGTNELDAIQICRGYVEAQQQYAQEKHDGSEVNQYAQRIISTPGKQDGLAWQNADGSWGGPVGEGIAKALAQGYSNRSQPYHGYFFKILKGQGTAAPLGATDFLVNGAMIGGFALAAAPADYRVTGVKTFVVSYEGIVYQKDLGPDSLSIFKEMQLYNPDKTWTRTDDSW